MLIDGKINRYYTKALEDGVKTVYDLFRWKTVSVTLRNYATGEIITDMRDLEFPEGYSQSACDIIAGKYFRKKGIRQENGTDEGEHSMRQLAHRMVNFWVEALCDEGLLSSAQKAIAYDELAYMLLAQMWAPNSPQWFNTGLKHSYGLEGPAQGHYYYDKNTGCVTASADAYTRTQGSACFIISVRDSLIGEKSLTDQMTTETLLFKYGSGVGTNWSPIRGKNEYLSGGGKSSGLMSFLKVSDRNAGAIKSGGTTRRAAKMNILNLDHPEIMDFIRWKALEEDKVEALGKMGYSTGIDGEAYDTVSGQNANNSVRIPNAFMHALEWQNPEALWQTKGRIDSAADGDLQISELWNATAYAAWRCGDPGVQFDDTINAWHTCPNGEDGETGAAHNRINASNPCSEYMFLDDTACNLASINIIKFYDADKRSFDLDGYLHSIRMIQLVLEATVHWGQFPTKDIARKSYLFRTTGLGLTNLGMLFMSMGLPYDSEEARHIAASLCALMTGHSYYMSAVMAEKIGPFPCYEINRASMSKVMRNHARAAACYEGSFEDMPYQPSVIDHKVLAGIGQEKLSKYVKRIWTAAVDAGAKHGFRNAQVTVLAPTGTIAFAMDCASTSSEPFFSHVAYKKLVGGGGMTIINPAIPTALKTLGYSAAEADAIAGYVMKADENGVILDGKIEGAPYLKPEHYAVFDTANVCGTGERYISPEGHVKMMAALTPHITGAISKTVNLPREATVEDIKSIYRLSWLMGVKAIALYRDGCKVSQPLSTGRDRSGEKALADYSYQELIDYIEQKVIVYKPKRVKPSGIRTAHVHEAAINGLKLYVTTSFYADGRLGEVYVSSGRQGSLTKGLLDSLSTTISEMLQYGIPPQDIARMYRRHKYEPSGFVSGHPFIKSVDSISDLISKIIDIEMGDYTYCQVKPEGTEPQLLTARIDTAAPAADTAPTAQITAVVTRLALDSSPAPTAVSSDTRSFLYGEVCSNCKGNKLVRNGTCKVCTECGTTTGCS